MPPVLDPSLCQRCGMCSRVCVFGLADTCDDGLPSFPDGAFCLECGHCIAVCPSGALSITGAGAPPAFPAGGNVSPEALGGYMRSRRSIRHYQEKSVDRRVLEEIFDIVRFAPTAANRQPVEWLIVHDTGTVRTLTGLAADWMRETAGRDSLYRTFPDAWDEGRDLICHGAPHLVVAHARADDTLASGDAMIALAHLDLALPAFGLGGCWAGLFTGAAASYPPLAEALGLPEGHRPFGTLLLGYPKYAYTSVPPRKQPAMRWL
ncbi:MAG: hypothetical protein PWP08_1296 [Methanofollis sp.]|nr:hypothetical protein [Methanofollis sp.]